MSYNQPISNMNPHTQPSVGDHYNPVHGQQPAYNQPGYNQSGYGQPGYHQPGLAHVGANPSAYGTGLGNTTAGLPSATSGAGIGHGAAGYDTGVSPTSGYGTGVAHRAGHGTGIGHQAGFSTTGPGTGSAYPTAGTTNRPRNPSMDIGLGRLEQAAGTLLSSQRMKDRGLQKEEAGRAARADAHAQAMQDHHLQRAERMESIAGAHRNRAVGAGAHPDYGQLGGPTGGTGVGGRQGL